MNKNVIKAALLGFGTVGTGVYKVLKNQEKEMSAKIGCKVEIKKILVRNIEKAAAKIEDASLLTSQWDEIINDPEMEIVDVYNRQDQCLRSGNSYISSDTGK